MFMKISLIFALALFFINTYAQANPKYDKWLNGSYFRGYNVLYESPKTQQDFIDFKNYGGNLFHIQPDGFFSPDAPYDTLWENVNGADMLVNFCRQAGIHYVIGMRSGPGAYDTYDESQGTTGESRVWNTGNTVEQNKYAEMLRMIVQRYANDTLFVGINLVIEPRPKVRMIPANTSQLYKTFLENVHNIHMDRIYDQWAASIRTVDPNIPIIIESFGYSTPELFPAYEIEDPFIVYSAHNYQPVEYSKAETPMSMNYPGTYWNLSTLSQQLFNGAFLRNTVFAKLKEFKETTGRPVFIGEFGMFRPQNGGADYIKDVLDICIENGWHFALWDWRRGGGQNWNIEGFLDAGNVHWKTTLSKFHAPPVPVQRSPLTGMAADVNAVFTWDSLTAFTTYDIEISMVSGSRDKTFIISDIAAASFSIASANLVEGQLYSWKVRSKNPGGLPSNRSSWSEPQFFSIENGVVNASVNNKSSFSLNQNSPNPFNPSTNISFELPKNSFVKLAVYDLLGREVAMLTNEIRGQGNHSVVFNASNLPSGVYIYKLQAEPGDGTAGFTQVKRMILVK